MTRSDDHLRQAAERFDEWADSYGDDRISGWFQHYQQMGLERLNFQGQETFLDVGCGTGWAVRCAASQLPGGQACGIDISPKMVEKATQQSLRCANCTFRIADAEHIPWESRYFERIFCSFSFHHYPNPAAVLTEFKRLLKPDGRLVIVDSARNVSLAIWLQDRCRRYFERSHVRYYTVDEMRALVEQAGFSIRGKIHTERGMLKHGKTFTGLMIIDCVLPGG